MGYPYTGAFLLSSYSSLPPINAFIQELVSRFSATDPKVNVGVLEVAHSIFVRWRPLFRTDELYMEINHVIETFGQAFLELLVVSTHNGNCCFFYT